MTHRNRFGQDLRLNLDLGLCVGLRPGLGLRLDLRPDRLPLRPLPMRRAGPVVTGPASSSLRRQTRSAAIRTYWKEPSL